MINAVAFEMGAYVQYFYSRLGVASIHMLGKYVKPIPVSSKNYVTLRTAIREVLDRC